MPKKTLGKYRVIWNASSPRLDSLRGMETIQKGASKVISANFNTWLPSTLNFELSSIESINESVKILADFAVRSGLPLLRKTIDLASWFRQHAVATADRWKNFLRFNGAYYCDHRVQMGRASAANNAQRVTFLVVELLERQEWNEKWVMRANQYAQNPGSRKSISAWQAT